MQSPHLQRGLNLAQTSRRSMTKLESCTIESIAAEHESSGRWTYDRCCSQSTRFGTTEEAGDYRGGEGASREYIFLLLPESEGFLCLNLHQHPFFLE